MRRHAQSTLHTATPHVLAACVSCKGVSSKPSQWECLLLGALKVGERPPQLIPLNSCTSEGKGEGGREGGRYGGRRRHLFSFIIKLKNPADSQNAPGGKRFSVSWVSQLPSGSKGLACYMSIKPVVKNTEEYLNAVSLSFINRCPSVQSLNGGGTLEDKGSCFLLFYCVHIFKL